MRYRIDYQYMPKDRSRPLDDGETVGIDATDASGVVILPNVGDYIEIDNEQLSFNGKVQSRLFRYIKTPSDIVCFVNIVVAETNDDWGALVKE